MKKMNFSEKGFSLIEILVAGTIVTIAFVGISGFLLFSREATEQTKASTKAVSLAEEALEAVRKLRDDSWANITAATPGTTYCPDVSSGTWELDAASPNCPEIDGYTTSVVLSSVCRDGSHNIAACGTNDPDTRKVVSTVTWESGNEKVELTTYITNFND